MMETRFIDGNEYVDRKTYIETRDENSRLRERIKELEHPVRQARMNAEKHLTTVKASAEYLRMQKRLAELEQVVSQYETHGRRIDAQRIRHLEARLDTVLKDLKASAEWDEQFIRIKTEEFRRLTDWSKRKGDR